MAFDPKKHFFLASAVAGLALLLIVSTLRLAVAAIGPSPSAERGAAMRATAVTAVIAAPRPFAEQIEVLGVAKGRQSVTITSNQAEIVTAVRFRDGQTVTRGQVLVDLKANEEAAGVAQARASVAQAKIEADRWARLAAADVASKQQAEQYATAYKQALAGLAAAQSRQGDRVIRAPFSGVVGISDIAPGALISPGAAIVTLDDLSHVRVDFDVPDRFLPLLREGAAITATTEAYPDTVATGKIAQIDSRIDVNTRTIKARAEFSNRDRRLKPGMLMHVRIERARREAVAAPEAAVAIDAAQPFVYVLASKDDATIVEQRDVVIGVRQNGFVEIKDGLRAGERIAADGLDRLRPNGRVRIVGGAGAAGPRGDPAAARREEAAALPKDVRAQ